MELACKLKVCVILSVLALILKIVVFVSPGWAVVRQDISVQPIDYILPPDDGLHADMPPERMAPEKHGVSISFGIWYYRVCMHKKDDHDDDSREDSSEEKDEIVRNKREATPKPEEEPTDQHWGDDKRKKHHHRHCKCYHRCYYRKDHHHGHHHHMTMDVSGEVDIPEEFKPAKDFITTSVKFASYGRHDIAAYVTIGLVLAVIGVIGAIKYARGGGVGKHSGRLACSTQVLSSFFFFMALIRVATYIIQLKVFRHHEILEGQIGNEARFIVPWCLILGGIAALIMDISALFHLILISRDRKYDKACAYQISHAKAPIIAPKGYVPYFNMVEEAGPLPEKQPIT